MVDPSPLDIRRLHAADTPAFRRLRLEALHREPLAFRASYQHETGLPIDYFEGRLTKGIVTGAFVDGILIASAGIDRALEPEAASTGILWGVYVRREQRGRGVAQAAIEAALAEARPHYSEIRLRVKATNLPARQLYARLGFSPVSSELATAADGRAYEYEWWLRPMSGR